MGLSICLQLVFMNMVIRIMLKAQNITQLDRKAVVTLIDKVIVYGKDRLEICFKYADEIQEMTEAAQNIREMEEREGRFKCGA